MTAQLKNGPSSRNRFVLDETVRKKLRDWFRALLKGAVTPGIHGIWDLYMFLQQRSKKDKPGSCVCGVGGPRVGCS